jgi:hypothetical protein
MNSKGDIRVRKRCGPALFNWARSANVTLSPELTSAVETGFPDGDDAFDAAIGLFGMLEVLLNRRTSGESNDERVTKLEGWIFGQTSTL